MVNTTLDIIVNMQVEAAKKQLTQLSNIVKYMNSEMSKSTPKGLEVEKTFKSLKQGAKVQEDIAETLGTQSQAYRDHSIYLSDQARKLKVHNKEWKEIQRNAKQFDFTILSLLFSGMFLERTFGGMFKSIIDSYKKAAGMNSQFNRSVLKLSANFEFLKFSIANALNSPFVISAIEWITDALQQLSDWVQDNPVFSTVLLGVLGSLWLFGKAFQIAAGFKQVFDLLTKLGVLDIEKIKTGLSTIKTKFTEAIEGIKKNWDKIIVGGLNLAGLVISASDLVDNIKKQNWGAVVGDAIASALYLAGVIASFFNPAVGLSLFVAGTLTLGFTKLITEGLEKDKLYESIFGGEKEFGKVRQNITSDELSKLSGLDKLSYKKLQDVSKISDSKIEEAALNKLFENYKNTYASVELAREQLNNNISQITQKEYVQLNQEYDKLQRDLNEIITTGTTLFSKEFTNMVSDYESAYRAIDTYQSKIKEQKDNLNLLNPTQEELNQKIQEYTDKINEATILDLFKGIDMEKFTDFKQTLTDIKSPLAEFNFGLSGEKGFYTSLFSINEILGTTLLGYMDNMNTYLSNGVSLTTSYNGVLTTQITNMDSLAKSTNNAAAAQERLNKAKEKAGGVVKKVYEAITGKSTTTG